MQKVILFLSLVLIGSCFLFCIPNAQAQEIGIRISPVRIEDNVDAGQSYKQSISVKNESDIPKTLYAYLRDFKADDENGTPRLMAPGTEEGYYLASWIQITSEGTVFEAREEKNIEFTINVPANTGPGGYFGAIYFGTVPPKLQLESEDKGAGMSVAQQAGCLVLLRVKGETDENAIIREFSTDKNYYNTPFDVKFILRIANDGNVHVKPYGTISIKNMFDKEVAVVRVNEKGSNILPDSIRRLETKWTGSSGFGRYKAEIGMTYGSSIEQGGQGKQSLYGFTTFWIFPWKIITIVLSVILVIGTLIFLLLKFYKNQVVQKAMEQAGLGHFRYVKTYQGPSPAMHLTIIIVIVVSIVCLLLGLAYVLFFS